MLNKNILKTMACLQINKKAAVWIETDYIVCQQYEIADFENLIGILLGTLSVGNIAYQHKTEKFSRGFIKSSCKDEKLIVIWYQK